MVVVYAFYFLDEGAPPSAVSRELASNDGRLRWLAVTTFFFHSTTVPFASALAKNVVSTCQAAAVMPALRFNQKDAT